MLTSSMTSKLINFYSMKISTKIKRREIKIVVDSLIEQLCIHFLKKQPDGMSNIRASINSILESADNPDRIILTKLDKVLRAYYQAFSKSYSDHTYNFNSFLDEELKDLILVLIQYNYIEDAELRSELRELL